jgi:hypothetical protein
MWVPSHHHPDYARLANSREMTKLTGSYYHSEDDRQSAQCCQAGTEFDHIKSNGLFPINPLRLIAD